MERRNQGRGMDGMTEVPVRGAREENTQMSRETNSTACGGAHWKDLLKGWRQEDHKRQVERSQTSPRE